MFKKSNNGFVAIAVAAIIPVILMITAHYEKFRESSQQNIVSENIASRCALASAYEFDVEKTLEVQKTKLYGIADKVLNTEMEKLYKINDVIAVDDNGVRLNPNDSKLVLSYNATYKQLSCTINFSINKEIKYNQVGIVQLPNYPTSKMIICIPTNHKSCNTTNGDIGEITNACSYWLLNDMSKFRVGLSLIPYSGKISAPSSRVWGKLSLPSYVFDSKDPLKVYHVLMCGFTDEKLCMNAHNPKENGICLYDTDPLNATSFYKWDIRPLDFYKVNPLTMTSTGYTDYLENPYAMIEFTYDLNVIIAHLNSMKTFSDNYNKSNFLFLPFLWSYHMLSSSFTQKIGSTNDLKMCVIIANDDEKFEPNELTFLGMADNNSSCLLFSSEVLNFSQPNPNLDTTSLKFVNVTGYNPFSYVSPKTIANGPNKRCRIKFINWNTKNYPVWKDFIPYVKLTVRPSEINKSSITIYGKKYDVTRPMKIHLVGDQSMRNIAYSQNRVSITKVDAQCIITPAQELIEKEKKSALFVHNFLENTKWYAETVSDIPSLFDAYLEGICKFQCMGGKVNSVDFCPVENCSNMKLGVTNCNSNVYVKYLSTKLSSEYGRHDERSISLTGNTFIPKVGQEYEICFDFVPTVDVDGCKMLINNVEVMSDSRSVKANQRSKAMSYRFYANDDRPVALKVTDKNNAAMMGVSINVNPLNRGISINPANIQLDDTNYSAPYARYEVDIFVEPSEKPSIQVIGNSLYSYNTTRFTVDTERTFFIRSSEMNLNSSDGYYFDVDGTNIELVEAEITNQSCGFAEFPSNFAEKTIDERLEIKGSSDLTSKLFDITRNAPKINDNWLLNPGQSITLKTKANVSLKSDPKITAEPLSKPSKAKFEIMVTEGGYSDTAIFIVSGNGVASGNSVTFSDDKIIIHVGHVNNNIGRTPLSCSPILGDKRIRYELENCVIDKIENRWSMFARIGDNTLNYPIDFIAHNSSLAKIGNYYYVVTNNPSNATFTIDFHIVRKHNEHVLSNRNFSLGKDFYFTLNPSGEETIVKYDVFNNMILGNDQKVGFLSDVCQKLDWSFWPSSNDVPILDASIKRINNENYICACDSPYCLVTLRRVDQEQVPTEAPVRHIGRVSVNGGVEQTFPGVLYLENLPLVAGKVRYKFKDAQLMCAHCKTTSSTPEYIPIDVHDQSIFLYVSGPDALGYYIYDLLPYVNDEFDEDYGFVTFDLSEDSRKYPGYKGVCSDIVYNPDLVPTLTCDDVTHLVGPQSVENSALNAAEDISLLTRPAVEITVPLDKPITVNNGDVEVISATYEHPQIVTREIFKNSNVNTSDAFTNCYVSVYNNKVIIKSNADEMKYCVKKKNLDVSMVMASYDGLRISNLPINQFAKYTIDGLLFRIYDRQTDRSYFWNGTATPIFPGLKIVDAYGKEVFSNKYIMTNYYSDRPNVFGIDYSGMERFKIVFGEMGLAGIKLNKQFCYPGEISNNLPSGETNSIEGRGSIFISRILGFDKNGKQLSILDEYVGQKSINLDTNLLKCFYIDQKYVLYLRDTIGSNRYLLTAVYSVLHDELLYGEYGYNEIMQYKYYKCEFHDDITSIFESNAPVCFFKSSRAGTSATVTALTDEVISVTASSTITDTAVLNNLVEDTSIPLKIDGFMARGIYRKGSTFTLRQRAEKEKIVGSVKLVVRAVEPECVVTLNKPSGNTDVNFSVGCFGNIVTDGFLGNDTATRNLIQNVATITIGYIYCPYSTYMGNDCALKYQLSNCAIKHVVMGGEYQGRYKFCQNNKNPMIDHDNSIIFFLLSGGLYFDDGWKMVEMSSVKCATRHVYFRDDTFSCGELTRSYFDADSSSSSSWCSTDREPKPIACEFDKRTDTWQLKTDDVGNHYVCSTLGIWYTTKVIVQKAPFCMQVPREKVIADPIGSVTVDGVVSPGFRSPFCQKINFDQEFIINKNTRILCACAKKNGKAVALDLRKNLISLGNGKYKIVKNKNLNLPITSFFQLSKELRTIPNYEMKYDLYPVKKIPAELRANVGEKEVEKLQTSLFKKSIDMDELNAGKTITLTAYSSPIKLLDIQACGSVCDVSPAEREIKKYNYGSVFSYFCDLKWEGNTYKKMYDNGSIIIGYPIGALESDLFTNVDKYNLYSVSGWYKTYYTNSTLFGTYGSTINNSAYDYIEMRVRPGCSNNGKNVVYDFDSYVKLYNAATPPSHVTFNIRRKNTVANSAFGLPNNAGWVNITHSTGGHNCIIFLENYGPKTSFVCNGSTVILKRGLNRICVFVASNTLALSGIGEHVRLHSVVFAGKLASGNNLVRTNYILEKFHQGNLNNLTKKCADKLLEANPDLRLFIIKYKTSSNILNNIIGKNIFHKTASNKEELNTALNEISSYFYENFIVPDPYIIQ